jgi:hypothetical protein
MSWKHECNKPNGKSTQWYKCKHPWEGQHKQHSKISQLARDYGVQIEVDKTFIVPGEVYGRYKISGNPCQVDKAKDAMSKWLQECQTMYFRNGGIF